MTIKGTPVTFWSTGPGTIPPLVCVKGVFQ